MSGREGGGGEEGLATTRMEEDPMPACDMKYLSWPFRSSNREIEIA